MEKNKIIYIQNLNTDIDNLYNELLNKKEQFLFVSCKGIKYVLTKDGYCSQELGNDAIFEKAANVGKTPEEIAKNPFKVPDIGNKPETPKKGFIGRFKNNGGR